MPLVSLNPAIPLYNAYGFPIGSIPLHRAIELDGVALRLRAKGTGLRRRFTSAKLYARTSIKWAIVPSDGFAVLQLVRE